MRRRWKQVTKKLALLQVWLLIFGMIPDFGMPMVRAEETSQEYVIIDDVQTDSSADHFFTFTEATDARGWIGWAADVKQSIGESDEAKSQHWVWNNQSNEEARKHTYTFTFVGTGVELRGVRNDAINNFQFDEEEIEETIIPASGGVVTLYSKKDQPYGRHTVSATLPVGNYTGLQVSYARVYGTKNNEEPETEIGETVTVDDTQIDNNQQHYFTYSQPSGNGANGWAADRKTTLGLQTEEAITQHWIWNGSNAEAKKHTYTFTFRGTGAQLWGIKSDEANDFKLDSEDMQTYPIDGDVKTLVKLYEVDGLAYGEHIISAACTDGNAYKGLQVSYAVVFGARPGEVVQPEEPAKPDTRISETFASNVKDGAYNCFKYVTYEGKNWTVNGSEAYIDLGGNDERAEQCYYEFPFVGSKISITATKANAHGKIKIFIDNEEKEIVDLYAVSRADAVVYTSEELTEEPHVLKVVTLNERSGSKVVNQLRSVTVTHEPYVLASIETATSIELIEGSKTKVMLTPVPEWAPLTGISYSVSGDAISVSDDGMVTANVQGDATITVNINEADPININVRVIPQIKTIQGSIVNENLQYTQDKYNDVKELSVNKKSLTAWQNDTAVSEIAIISVDSSISGVKAVASDFRSGKNTIDAANIETTFVKSVEAFTGMQGYGYAPNRYPVGNRKESSDVLYTTGPVDIPFNGVCPLWVSINVPKGTPGGVYKGNIQITTEDTESPLVFEYELTVRGVELADSTEFKNGFDIELWQYPYTSAEYYNVTPFSEEHFAILTSIMEKYKSIGGHAITTTINEDAWDRQTYSKNDIHYPSMVKWTKNANGSFSYDYSDFDAWVSFCKRLGIGDKIVIYSIAPWHNSFTYWENDQMKREKYTVGNDRYNKVWTDFFKDLIAHLDANDWFEDAYVGIDERGLNQTAINLLASLSNKDGKKIKTAGAMDSITSGDHPTLARLITDLNVGDNVAQGNKAAVDRLIADRNALGLKTQLYSCTGHKPGNFSLSAPGESYWSMMYAYKSGASGFLRWAYDAWVEDPLRDTSHSSFESGDCFLIFPDEKDASNPTAKSSIRLEKMAQGVRDVNKLIAMLKEFPQLQADVNALLSTLKTTYPSSGYYLTDDGKAAVAADMTAVHDGIDAITVKYMELKGIEISSGDEEPEEEDDVQLPELGEVAREYTLFTGNSVKAGDEFVVTYLNQYNRTRALYCADTRTDVFDITRNGDTVTLLDRFDGKYQVWVVVSLGNGKFALKSRRDDDTYYLSMQENSTRGRIVKTPEPVLFTFNGDGTCTISDPERVNYLRNNDGGNNDSQFIVNSGEVYRNMKLYIRK